MATKLKQASIRRPGYLSSRETAEFYIAYKEVIQGKLDDRKYCIDALKEDLLATFESVPHMSRGEISGLRRHIKNEIEFAQKVGESLCELLTEIELKQIDLRQLLSSEGSSNESKN